MACRQFISNYIAFSAALLMSLPALSGEIVELLPPDGSAWVHGDENVQYIGKKPYLMGLTESKRYVLTELASMKTIVNVEIKEEFDYWQPLLDGDEDDVRKDYRATTAKYFFKTYKEIEAEDSYTGIETFYHTLSGRKLFQVVNEYFEEEEDDDDDYSEDLKDGDYSHYCVLEGFLCESFIKIKDGQTVDILYRFYEDKSGKLHWEYRSGLLGSEVLIDSRHYGRVYLQGILDGKSVVEIINVKEKSATLVPAPFADFVVAHDNYANREAMHFILANDEGDKDQELNIVDPATLKVRKSILLSSTWGQELEYEHSDDDRRIIIENILYDGVTGEKLADLTTGGGYSKDEPLRISPNFDAAFAHCTFMDLLSFESNELKDYDCDRDKGEIQARAMVFWARLKDDFYNRGYFYFNADTKQVDKIELPSSRRGFEEIESLRNGNIVFKYNRRGGTSLLYNPKTKTLHEGWGNIREFDGAKYVLVRKPEDNRYKLISPEDYSLLHDIELEDYSYLYLQYYEDGFAVFRGRKKSTGKSTHFKYVFP